jgi:hypothetical protein
MSTARQREMGLKSRWAVPAFCVLAAGAYLGIFLSTGQVALAFVTAGIMLAYGAILVAFSGRSEIAAILRNDRTDERRHSIYMRASALTLHVIVLFVLAMAFVQLAQGRSPGDWGTLCLIGGTSFIAGVIFFSRRG